MSARGKGSGSRALQRLAAGAWPLLQGTAAATAAWLIAKEVLGHEQPFFAPIAAFIGLNAAVGERGLNAVRLLLGVIVGIAVGELTVLALGGGYGRIAVAVFGATPLPSGSEASASWSRRRRRARS